jgi:hypothetical protein
MGGTWGEPKEDKDPAVDCVSEDSSTSNGEPMRLEIQVVRVFSDPAVWKELAFTGIFEMPDLGVDQIADSILATVQKKRGRYAPETRSRLVLVLDATRFPVAALDSITENITKRHLAAIRSAGFRSIWIVGPVETLTREIA